MGTIFLTNHENGCLYSYNDRKGCPKAVCLNGHNLFFESQICCVHSYNEWNPCIGAQVKLEWAQPFGLTAEMVVTNIHRLEAISEGMGDISMSTSFLPTDQMCRNGCDNR